MKGHFFKVLLLIFIVAAIILFWNSNLQGLLTFDALKQNEANLRNHSASDPFKFTSLFFGIYVFATALSFPGATLLTLAAGSIFGLVTGTLVVSFASTIGATLAFILSRFLFRDFIEKKFSDKLSKIEAGIETEGGSYLFGLRLVPVFPFFLVNLLMGLTKMNTFKYAWVSQLGMLPGTIVYVNAGTQLAKLESLKGILDVKFLLSFALLGVFPIISKKLMGAFKRKKSLKKFRRPNSFEFNTVVIGGGSAGLVSAYITAAVKAKVALIEKHKMGGDCLNTGCVPSKALIRSAKVIAQAKRAEEFGLKRVNVEFDFADIMERVTRIVKLVEPHDSVERYSALGVDCIQGNAKILSPYEVEVNGKTLTTRNIIIATGARPFVPPIPGLKDANMYTSDTIWNLRKLPERMIVLGGGPIGCELAQCFVRLGAQVVLIEGAERIMPREDEDAATCVQKRFENEGITILTAHKAVEVINERQVIICESGSKKIEVAFDAILVAVGRKPNVDGFGLEELGIEITTKGSIESNEYLETNYPNIFVCGDVAGHYQFTHTASHQAWYAAVNALFGPFKKFKVDYRVIPWATFTEPEVARVGLSESEAKEKNIAYEVTKFDLEELDRAIADSEAHGFVKVLTVPGKDTVLGATIVGEHAGDIITEFVTAMKFKIGLNKILSTIHIYPTLAEANKYVAGRWKRNHAPLGILNILRKFHSWRRGAFIILAGTTFIFAQDSYAFDKTHNTFDKLLKENVTINQGESRVDYRKIKANPKLLQSYLAQLQTLTKDEYTKFTEAEKIAFLINAYNAYTLDLIVRNYPVKSIKDLGGLLSSPWKKKFFKLFRQDMSLDGIEHGMLRKDFNEPRIHFAVNCASKGCPPMANEAFGGDRLHEQLEKSALLFIQNPKQNRYDPKSDTLYASSIFKWYGSDFDKTYGSYQAYVAPRITQNKTEQEKILKRKVKEVFNDYDWMLNE